MSEITLVYVSTDGKDTAAGTLWFYSRGGRESASFEYNPDWLTQGHFALEPALQLTAGTFHTRAGLSLFGAMGDSAPDRWGRILMRRNEEHQAKSEGRTPCTLSELDYLLGINDEGRQGALRFKKNPDGLFLSASEKNDIPPLLALPKLLSASERFLESKESDEDLRLLLAPGSSLGGARPKASVYDKDGELAIAKFPRRDDEYNTVLWEALALSLAAKAGITVPSWRLEQIGGKAVLLIKRFDRRGKKRIPFLSAMSMLGARDNEDHSYPEIAYAISRYGGAPEQDLTELWRRMVFNMAISNTDDHLRNHGFLYDQKGWRLSPVYDMNPVARTVGPRILSLAIDFNSREASLETALSSAAEFRLKKDQTLGIIQEVRFAAAQWQSTARALKIPAAEIKRMASAFAEL
jgi:serine/threonine-protein kinase HipA